MTNNKFDELLQFTLHTIQTVMGLKSGEYSRNDDKLHNFKRAAGVLGTTPEKALLGMMTKHTVSILDIVDDLEKGKLPSAELLAEKIGDELNYLILLKALIMERIILKTTITCAACQQQVLTHETTAIDCKVLCAACYPEYILARPEPFIKAHHDSRIMLNNIVYSDRHLYVLI